MLRTHTCGELNERFIDKDVTLSGWVHSRRDHGELVFIDLRDAYGVTQVVFDPQHDRAVHTAAGGLRSEYVVKIEGKVRLRPAETGNDKISTGKIEVIADKMTILNTSLTPPFEVDDMTNVSEESRLKYRYVDLRRPKMQKNLRLRYKISKIMRDYLDSHNFIDIETPVLTKSTPEGARDYIVPSRVQEGNFYALPQSPQLFKQILMVAGFDRYYQIARCFRDEDLRADRQPEFTQLDMEMSFVEEEDIFTICEGLMKELFFKVAGIKIETPFKRIAYEDAITRYGSDKPDTRIPIEIKTITELVKDCGFNVFKKTVKSGGVVAGFAAKGCASYSRSKIDELTKYAQEMGAKGLAYFIMGEDKINSPIMKFFTEDEINAIVKETGASKGDMIFFVADKKRITYEVLGALRVKIAQMQGLIDESKFDLLWVVDFPLFKYNEEEKRWDSEHHPFTSCREEDFQSLKEGRYKGIKSRSYDFVINGVELASGSIRIHSREMQEKIFEIIGITKEEVDARFGFLMEAFKYGAPPHGGIAFGLDRFTTLFTKSESIRDVIAFPKTQRAICQMTGAPSEIDGKQLKELGIEIKK